MSIAGAGGGFAIVFVLLLALVSIRIVFDGAPNCCISCNVLVTASLVSTSLASGNEGIQLVCIGGKHFAAPRQPCMWRKPALKATAYTAMGEFSG